MSLFRLKLEFSVIPPLLMNTIGRGPARASRIVETGLTHDA